MDPAGPVTGRLCFTQVKAYGLGDRFLDVGFQRAMNEAIAKDVKWELTFPTDMVSIIEWAFENIPSDRPLLQLLVNYFCHTWNEAEDDNENAEALKLMPCAYSARVMRRLAEMRREDTLQHSTACYLEHATGDERKACKKPHVYYDGGHDYGYLNMD